MKFMESEVVEVNKKKGSWSETKTVIVTHVPVFVGMLVILLVNMFSIGLSGSGTQNDPYQISECRDFQVINLQLSSHYSLINDIDFDQCPEKIFHPIAPGSDYDYEFLPSQEPSMGMDLHSVISI